ncbi:MAG: PQQ-binding-like beta-propeller repeat protein, partial [Planctomycetota bacterium]
DQGLYSGACSTPEYDSQSGLLFTLGVDGDLIAWDAGRTGQRVWSLNLYERYGAQQRPEVAVRKKTQRDYGYVSSPLVLDNQLIVEAGGKTGNLVAFDKQTGRELWTSENRDEAGHTGGPVPIRVEGASCVAVLTLRNLVVTRIDGANAGKTVAVYPWTTDFGNNIATPAVSGDSVIVTSAYNHYAMCRLKVTLQGATKVWENELASGVCSPIVHEDRVYWAWRGVHCVDFATGKELWSGGKVGAEGSCVLTGDDRLIVYANRGDLSLVETAKRSPRQYTQLAAETVLSKTEAWPHVVLANGRLLCRDRSGSVHCIAVSPDITAKASNR